MRAFFWILLCAGCGSSETSSDASASGDANADAPKQDASPTDASVMDAAVPDAAEAGADAAVDAGPGSYLAYGLIGGLDRVRVVKIVGNTCFLVQLVSPSNDGKGLTLPNGWGFEQARALQPSGACNPAYLGPVQNTYDATGQAGTIAFAGNGVPSTITTVNVTLSFANAPNWCPPSQALVTSNLPVQ